MPFVSVEGFSEWESPLVLDSLAGDVRDKSAGFEGHVVDAHTQWVGLAAHYEGDAQEVLYAGLDSSVALADDIKVFGDSVASALEVLCDELTLLHRRRGEHASAVEFFHGLYQPLTYAELDPMDQGWYDQLVAEVAVLQGEYESVIDAAVNTINGLEITPLPSITDSGDASTDGVLRGVEGVANSWALTVGATFLGGQRVQKTTTSSRKIEERLGPDGEVVERKSSVVSRARVRDTSSVFNTVLWHGPGGVLGVMGRDWDNAKAQAAELRRQRQAAFKGGVLQGAAWSARKFKKDFVAGLPLAGLREEFRSSKRTRSTREVVSENKNSRVIAEKTTEVKESKLSKAVRIGGKVFGAGGSALSAGLTFNDEKKKNVEKLRRENPRMSDEEILKEAGFDAAANTAGQIGMSVAAGAAAGAAVGSVIPVGGTIIGGAAGAVAGVVASGLVDNLKILPDSDGDGEKESISSALGNKIEGLANSSRDAAKEAGKVADDAKNKIAGMLGLK
ncbi:MAG: hypothetical protein Q4C81_07435 [Kocuria sp.]|nr:hypothetical protein [Kocuria sp.]